MNIFLSKYINNLDKKGRVSIPASYRLALSSQSFNGVIVYPSFRNKCIEACSLKRLEELSQIIQTLDPYSEERDAFETIILGEAIQLSFDSEGRVILPKSLIDHAGISDQACFVGKGLVFEIWQPQNFETYLSSARQIAQDNRLTLKNINKDI
ncbi:division/cell wall cluster transcriptional repressor MraZ [Candidatus Tisiphia endosymbiont of Ptychoptera albimana]|uniref:division/cell wall cluster transcriptional repressor MraZ n=1 Tax=Candidatus Tisiphia endosymbiont of Ptychoptera albimana TaxID=3066260 RepID=UPI00312CC01F